MSKARSTCKDWDFVSKGTEISVGRFLIEYFTPVTAKGAEAHCPDVKKVEKTFWLSRPDGWVINKKTKRIIMLEFKRASDILEGLNALAGERGWVVEVLPLVAGQRSVREKE